MFCTQTEQTPALLPPERSRHRIKGGPPPTSESTSLQSQLAAGTPSACGRLPYEINLTIFAHSLHIDEYHDGDASTTHLPWNLSHVCQDWRELVLSSPQLWTQIFLRTKEVTPFSHCLLRWQLHYSQNCPLDVRIRMGSQPPNIPVLDALKAIVAHHQRWASLEVSDGRSYFLEMLPTSRPNIPSEVFFPILTKLSWYFWRLEVLRGDLSFSYFANCPALRSVTIPKSKRQWDLSRIRVMQLPWGQLTHLSFLGPERYIILDVLPNLSNLVELELADSTSSGGSIPNSSSHYSFPFLERLDLRGCTHDLILHILRHSDFSLSFRFLGIPQFPHSSLPPLSPALRSLPKSVEEMNISMCLRPPGLAEFIRILPSSVRRLQMHVNVLGSTELWLSEIGRGFLRYPTSDWDWRGSPRPYDGLACPRLETLSFYRSSPSLSTANYKPRIKSEFTEMLEERRGLKRDELVGDIDVTLRSVEIDARVEWSSRDLERLKKLGDAGLRIVRVSASDGIDHDGTVPYSPVDGLGFDSDSDESDWEL